MTVVPSSLSRRLDMARIVREIVKGIPAGLVISLNAWATILINSQPRWLFRKKRWSEAEMRSISCYYLVIAYLMLRIVRLTSSLTKRPGRPYGDFFRHTRPILGQVAIFSIATMMFDEFIMFYILRKFGHEKQRIMITGQPLDKDTEFSDDDCCICYGAMLDDDDINDRDEYCNMNGSGGVSRDTDHVLENFCVVKQHVAHRGCIRKWYDYGPKGYRPMQAFRILSWRTTLHGAVAGMNTPRIIGNRMGLRWFSQSPPTGENEVQLRVPLVRQPAEDGLTTTETAVTMHGPTEHEHVHADEPTQQTQEGREETEEMENAAAAAEPALRPLFTQREDYDPTGNAGRKTCPACRQQLILNFVDLKKGRKEMGYMQKLSLLGQDMTKFSDWRGLILRSLITAGWVGMTIVGGKLRIVAMDKSIMKHQQNRALATMSALALSS
ncbi:hypothetical protein BGX21_007710 [Mortierella sp. AD011]|nr:hypothetical protein BGX21_007710 [Mortierella sp. AD011]